MLPFLASRLRGLALEAVGPSAEALQALLGPHQGLSDPSAELRRRCIELLGSFERQRESVLAVGRCLFDEDATVRQAAEHFLSQKHDVRAIDVALKCLEHPLSVVRGSGIRVLGAIAKRDAQAISGIMRYLGEADTQSTACLAFIAVLGPVKASKIIFSRVPQCVAVLASKMPNGWLSRRAARYLCHREPQTRLAALRTLRGDLKPKLLRRVALRLLDKDLSVRGAALKVCLQAPKRCILRVLVPHLHRRLAQTAFRRLSEGSEGCLELLRPALARPGARGAARRLLSQLCVGCEEKALQMAMEDSKSLAMVLEVIAKTQASISRPLLDAVSRAVQPCALCTLRFAKLLAYQEP